MTPKSGRKNNWREISDQILKSAQQRAFNGYSVELVVSRNGYIASIRMNFMAYCLFPKQCTRFICTPPSCCKSLSGEIHDELKEMTRKMIVFV